MTNKKYITLDEGEKQRIKQAMEKDSRFTDSSRISDGAWLSMVATEYVSNQSEVAE